ncbi:MAG TPA: hypothetical protein VM324_02550 [Egibacteraceae bacterium]|nr:hypothetical protein [Egibacteraceae bacterium]
MNTRDLAISSPAFARGAVPATCTSDRMEGQVIDRNRLVGTYER